MRHRARRVARLTGAGALVLGLSLAAGAATAAPVPETGRPGYLTLAAEPYPAQFGVLEPGDTTTWLIDAALTDADTARLALELRGWGGLIDDGLTVTVRSCDEPFAGATGVAVSDRSRLPACTGTGGTVVPTAPLSAVADRTSSDTWELAPLHRDSPRHLAVDFGRPTEAAGSGAGGRVAVGLHAAGDDPGPPDSPVPSPEGLPKTGLSALAGLLVVAGTVLLGFGLRRTAEPGRRDKLGDTHIASGNLSVSDR